jgi:hypothetical protein
MTRKDIILQYTCYFVIHILLILQLVFFLVKVIRPSTSRLLIFTSVIPLIRCIYMILVKCKKPEKDLEFMIIENTLVDHRPKYSSRCVDILGYFFMLMLIVNILRNY